MRGTLIVTNDFPPRQGGIQSFVHGLACLLPPDQVAVYAPAWDGAKAFDSRQPFPVIRHPTSLMLPVPGVARRAVAALREYDCDTVMFGAAAPLGLLAPTLRRAGATRQVALTHGHEAGWAALPGARGLLRRIGDGVDVVTYLGEYFRARLAKAMSPQAAARMVRLAPGVDVATFRDARPAELPAGGPIVLCVSRLVPRKGQDTLIRAWPAVRQAASRRRGCCWWVAARTGTRWSAWPASWACPAQSPSPGALPTAPCPATTRPATCSPCRAAPGGPGWTWRAWASSTWRRRRPDCR